MESAKNPSLSTLPSQKEGKDESKEKKQFFQQILVALILFIMTGTYMMTTLGFRELSHSSFNSRGTKSSYSSCKEDDLILCDDFYKHRN